MLTRSKLLLWLFAMTTRRAAILRRLATMATARCSAYCVFCGVIAQRLSIQLLGSLRWPAAEEKHGPQNTQYD